MEKPGICSLRAKGKQLTTLDASTHDNMTRYETSHNTVTRHDMFWHA